MDTLSAEGSDASRIVCPGHFTGAQSDCDLGNLDAAGLVTFGS